MTSTPKHTPLPWHVSAKDNKFILSASGRYVAECFLLPAPYLPQADNAALIVRAVNNHDALVAALSAIVKADDNQELEQALIEHARAALAKVRGEA